MKAIDLKRLLALFLLISMCAGCSERMHAAREASREELGRGISIGNALESPRGDFWGVEMKNEYFDAIKEAGFDFVRLPVRFPDYFDPADYRLDETFLKRIDGCIEHGLSLGLTIILDLHHYDRMMELPCEERGKFIAMWRQLAERYSGCPNGLIFELLNEPGGNLDSALWNQILSEAIGAIRESNPDRLIVVGGGQGGAPEGLTALTLPHDEHLAVTFHYYRPAEFTFQGNAHHPGYEHLSDIAWLPGEEELAAIRGDFETVRLWAEQNNVQVLLGEFGAVSTIPFEYRGKWTLAIVTIAEEMGFSWCYWELGSWFGIMDTETLEWDSKMLRILLRG